MMGRRSFLRVAVGWVMRRVLGRWGARPGPGRAGDEGVRGLPHVPTPPGGMGIPLLIPLRVGKDERWRVWLPVVKK